MKILWIEDFGGGLAPSKVILDIFGDIISNAILDHYDADNEDVAGQLRVLFEENTLHRIFVCKSYTDWKDTFSREGRDFDVALIDINLEAYKTPVDKLPEGTSSIGFDKKAGFHIYHQLLKSGFLDDNIAFFTGEENSLRDFSRYCGEILIEKPKYTFEKKDSDFKRLRHWLGSKASTEELILKRGIIEGCRFIRNELNKIALSDVEDRLLFFKTTSLKVDHDPETYKAELVDYLTKLESFFLWYRDEHKSHLLLSFIRELAEKWNISSGYFSRDKQLPTFRSQLEDRFHRTTQLQMKRLRNWSVHGLLPSTVSEKDVAYFFMLAMRGWLRFDITESFEYESILSQLFQCLSPEEMEFSMSSEIERQLEESYFDLKALYSDLTRSTQNPDGLSAENYFLAFCKALGEVPERIQGHQSDVIKRKIRLTSMRLFYQSHWHGLFPLWFKSNYYPNLESVGFNIETIPRDSFLFLLGRATFVEAFGTPKQAASKARAAG
jgi:hypothetical protein